MATARGSQLRTIFLILNMTSFLPLIPRLGVYNLACLYIQVFKRAVLYTPSTCNRGRKLVMFRIRNIVRSWLPLAVAITLLSGLIYGAVQQVLRQDANDPQIQMAQDTAAALTAGAAPESLASATPVDIALSLA